jgi:hypothetical protein
MFSSRSSSVLTCAAPARSLLQYSVVCSDLLHDTNVHPVSEFDDCERI